MGLSRIVSKSTVFYGFFLAGFIYGQAVSAEENLGSETTSKEQMLELLKLAPGEGAAPQPGMVMRSMVKKPKAVSMEIRFDFNSTAVNDEAKHQLRPVGEVMEELKDQKFVVEGHTDSKGDEAANQRLSERRAASVKKFLLNRYEIEPSRITSVGKGEADPLDPSDPEGEANRRVKIVTYR